MIGLLVIALPFAAIGGVMAFLIQYEEMAHHLHRRAALVVAVEAGAVAFVALGVLSMAFAYLLGFRP